MIRINDSIVDRCHRCKGTGRIIEHWRGGGASWESLSGRDCPRCDGTGYVRFAPDEIKWITPRIEGQQDDDEDEDDDYGPVSGW